MLKIFCFFLGFILIAPSSAFAGKVTVITSHPAPFGVYQRLKLAPSKNHNLTCNAAAEGVVIYDPITRNLMVCRGSANEWIILGDLWFSSSDEIDFKEIDLPEAYNILGDMTAAVIRPKNSSSETKYVGFVSNLDPYRSLYSGQKIKSPMAVVAPMARVIQYHIGEVNRLRQESGNHKSRIVVLEGAVSALEAKNAALNNIVQKLSSENESLTTELTQLRASLADLENKLNKLSSQVSSVFNFPK